MNRLAKIVTVCAALVWLAPLRQRPIRGDDFYQGKTISLIIPIGPGGAYDAYGRLVARHLRKHIPGSPTIVPRNMPGGGGVVASNHVYNVAPAATAPHSSSSPRLSRSSRCLTVPRSNTTRETFTALVA